ncbi:MAG: hypothetical protein H6702_01815 [Myxococcales bacterium]|nr:hypothetical protein [Myxococcales bacterium]
MHPLTLTSLCLAILAAPAAGICGDGDGVRLTISGPAVPYAEVVHEIRERNEAVTARVTKTFAGDFGRRDAIGLLTLAELPSLLSEARTAVLEARAPVGPARYHLEITQTGQRRQGWLVPGEGGAEPALATRLRAVVAAATGPVPFHDALLLPEEAGRLHVQADRPARVALDGVDLAGQTPLSGVLVVAGDHAVRLTPLDGGEAQVYPIKILPGRTTTLAVELR